MAGAPKLLMIGGAGQVSTIPVPDENAWRTEMLLREARQRQEARRQEARERLLSKPPLNKRTRAHQVHDGACGVYFIEGVGTGLVKIGVTVDLGSRLRTMQGGSPVPLRVMCIVPGGRDVEEALHHRFKTLRAHGEWFRLEADLQEFINRPALEDK